jgi:prepilin-type N-terminal cleavage/methylation domain-containing protein/prepilin-type processing-associated H-X9-DG protein
MPPRKAFTLLELMIVIVAGSLMLGLAFISVQKVRMAAKGTQCQNNHRQVGLALANYAGNHHGKYPNFRRDAFADEPKFGLFHDISFYLTLSLQDASLRDAGEQAFEIEQLICPADTSLAASNWKPPYWQISSVVANALVFARPYQIRPEIYIQDGCSNTILFVEKYAGVCGITRSSWFNPDNDSCDDSVASRKITLQLRSTFSDAGPIPEQIDIVTRTSHGWVTRPFQGRDDVYPITEIFNGVTTTRPSKSGLTFQSRPSMNDCDYRIPQTSHPGGLPVSFADGSVRWVSPGIEPSVFWSMVTPNSADTTMFD